MYKHSSACHSFDKSTVHEGLKQTGMPHTISKYCLNETLLPLILIVSRR